MSEEKHPIQPKSAAYCPMCDEKNSCGMEKGETTCWCFSVTFSKDLKANLENNFANKSCICKNCFEKQNEKSKD